MDAAKLDKYAVGCIAAFATVRPDWQTPHKTLFKVAKKMGLSAVVDGMTEKEYDAEWEQLFEDGLLEGDRIPVILSGEGGKAKLVFRSDDLRHLKRVK